MMTAPLVSAMKGALFGVLIQQHHHRRRAHVAALVDVEQHLVFIDLELF